MNIARAIYPIARRNVGNNIYRNFRISSTNLESAQATQPQVKEEKFDFEDLKVLERKERRKPPIEPFMKNVFLSKFDRELLAYPEILNKDEKEDLDRRAELLEKTFNDASKTSLERRHTAIQAKLFAAPCRLTNNGLAMIVTERMRYLEAISSDLPLAKELSEHWIGLQILEKCLPVEEYEKLLPKLTDGEQTVGICVKETIATRITKEEFRTVAVKDQHGVWRLTGEKEQRAPTSNKHLIVLAAIEGSRMGLFLVEPKSQGVTEGEGRVKFTETPVTPLQLGSGETLTPLLVLSRLDAAAVARAHLAMVLREAVTYIRGRFIGEQPLADLPIIRNKVGSTLMCLYASESSLYFTAGLLDGYEKPDAELEMAMCRNYITRHGASALRRLLGIPGLQGEGFASMFADFASLTNWDEVEQNVDIYIALNGLHHAGKLLSDEVKQLRNPLHFPKFIFKKLIANRHQERDDPKLTLHLAEHLHPSLQTAAQALEYSTLRLRHAVEIMLSRHGADVCTEHADLERLAQITTDILALSATLARASRSYCIGIRNAEVEMKIAAAMAEQIKTRVRTLIMEIENGEYLNMDYVRKHVGKKALDSTSLVLERPIERVFW